MDKVISKTSRLHGVITVPGDKSISHRAVILASIANGVTQVTNFAPAEDPLSTVACMRQLGVQIDALEDGRTLVVHGKGLRGLEEPGDVMDAGNSGTTMRLLAGLLAGQGFFSVLTGDKSLRNRPMGRVIEPLRKMGAKIMARKGGRLAPLAIQGSSLSGIEYEMPVASAQVKSALILAGLNANGTTAIVEPSRSRDHTERMLRNMGAAVTSEGNVITVRPGKELTAVNVNIPGDFSSAAFFLIAGCIVPGSEVRINNVNINPTRAGLLNVLEEMGAAVALEGNRESGGEPVADIIAKSGSLAGVDVGGDLIPALIDEIPVLAVAGAIARGATTIRDAAELRVKESDRIAAMASELAKMGVDITELPDGLRIVGGRRLRGAVVDSHGDHRVAMALAVAALAAEGETVIQNWDCVNISFPSFEAVLNELSHSGRR